MWTKTNELYHHGVLGQEWGKRNGPPYPLSSSDHSSSEKKAGWKKSLDPKSALREGRNREIAKQDYTGSAMTPEQKERLKKIAIAAVVTAGVAGACYLAYKTHGVDSISQAAKNGVPYEAMKPVLDKAFSETGGVLKEGDVVHRMVGFKDFDVQKANDNLFVMGNEKDRQVYANFLKDFNGTGKKYDVALKATKDINIPSKTKAQEIFNELWRSDPAYQDQLLDTVSKIYEGGGTPPGLAKIYAAAALHQDGFNAAVTGIAKPSEATSKFVGALKKQGFDAIADYHDINDKLSDTPLIVFDPKGTLQKVGEQIVDNDYKRAGLTGLKESGVTKLLGMRIDDILRTIRR